MNEKKKRKGEEVGSSRRSQFSCLDNKRKKLPKNPKEKRVEEGKAVSRKESAISNFHPD
jgi:hypothetical protein